jgi:hypothetical protein
VCLNLWCPCGWPEKEITDEFVGLWDLSFTAKEEAYFLTEPDIAGPLRELDQRQRAEKNLRRKQRRDDN